MPRTILDDHGIYDTSNNSACDGSSTASSSSWPIHPPSVTDAVMAYSVICDRPLNDVMFLPWSKMPYAVMNYNFLAYNHIMLIV